MVPKRKKVSLWFIILGAILSGYAGYLLNGHGSREGISTPSFPLLTVCAQHHLQIIIMREQ